MADTGKENARPGDETGRAQVTPKAQESKSAMNFDEHLAAASGVRKPSLLQPYLDAHLTLIPLDGKKPRGDGWQKRSYDVAAVVAAAVKSGGNLGVRLPSDLLVVDVDPRNFGDDPHSFDRLKADFGFDEDDFPHVRTGGGGLHVYMRKPAELLTLESLEGYPGVEFKSVGRQVVAAGSIHPDTGKPYVAVNLELLALEQPAPPKLLQALERIARSRGNTEAGELTAEQVAEALENVDPTDFKDHDKWLELMMSAHHATAGEARQEFIDWSTSDPDYFGHAWIIGRRWDSLHDTPNRGGKPITARSFFAIVQKHGSDVPNLPPEQDFEATEEVVTVGKDAIDDLNERHAVVFEGGKFRIFTEEFDPVLGRTFFQRSTREDFVNLYCNQLVESNDKLVTKGDLWLKSARRRQYKGVIFDPQQDHGGWLNLWKGWAVQPKPGDWSLLKELIRDVLVDRDKASFEYVMNWMAYLFQHPNRPAEVAIAFKGDKGTGKGTLGRALHELVGRHSLHISSPEHLVGRFNSHLQNCVFLFADEAFWAGDKAGESKLKQLVTEPTLAYEGKGRDAVMGKNLIHILMASNSDWVVPAGLDGERRFAVFEVNNERKGDETFFNSLNRQLYENGGLAAMLQELLTRDLGDWTPRRSVPQTKALAEQKAMSMSPEEAWWDELLVMGVSPRPFAEPDEWANGPLTVDISALHGLYVDYVRRHGMGRARPLQGFAMAIKRKAGVTKRMIDRKWYWVLPRLEEARAHWTKAIGRTDSDEVCAPS